MTKKNGTKRSLLMSAVALVLCFSMLVGSTFAWFTDSVTSSGNKIQAGNLDVQLLMDTGSGYVDISADTAPIFGAGAIAQDNNAQTLWEPGKTQVAYLAIKNNGSLALKYSVALKVDNVSKDLYKAMKYDIVEDATKTNPVTAWTSGTAVTPGIQSASDEVSLAVGETHYFALAIHMDESAGNEYQNGEVNFDLTVLATQDTVESDSFDNEYDKDATYTISVNTTNELVSSFENMTEATVFNATGVTVDVDTDGTIGELMVPVFSIPTGATVKGAEFKFGASMISAEATAVSDTVVFDECDIVTADADVTDGMPAMAIVGEMGTSVSSTKYVFNNCTFKGYIMLNGINAEFNNCTFVLSNENDGATYCSFGEYVFNNCTFNYENGTNLIADSTIYADSYATVVLNDCTLAGATYGNSEDSTITVE